jgi:hypothetical protein
MTNETIDILRWALPSFLSVVAGVGGAIKFWAWFRDRRIQQRVESSAAILDRCDQSWQKEFAIDEFWIANFARLKRVDVRQGHAALLRCAHELGDTNSVWSLFGRLQFLLRFPNRMTTTIRWRRWFVVLVVVGFIACLAFAVAALAVLAFIFQYSFTHHWSQVTSTDLASLAILSIYMFVFSCLTWLSGLVAGKMLDLWMLRRQLRGARSTALRRRQSRRMWVSGQ